MKLSLVIPARDEAAQIGATITSLVQHLDSVEVSDLDVIVVDDGSRDSTAAVVAQLGAADPRIRLISNAGEHGYGRAVRCGLDHLEGDVVVITMADASDSPADVETYYRVLCDEAECAFGSRFIKGAVVVDYPLLKLIINRVVNTVIRMLFGLRYNDTTNAFKGYRRYVIDGCRPYVSPHFNLTVEMPLKAVARGYSHKVVPVSWHNRAAGQSHLVLKEQGSRYLFALLTVWFEWLLVRRDYRRRDEADQHPWPDEHGSGTTGVQP